MFRLEIITSLSKINFIFNNEVEVYRMIYCLEKHFKNIAFSNIYYNDIKILCRTLGKRPKQVYNPFTDNWVPFENFLKRFYDFPLTTRMLYANYLKHLDKDLMVYGFYENLS